MRSLERKVNTLVLVHRAQLIDQWHEQLKKFLDLPDKKYWSIGRRQEKVNTNGGYRYYSIVKQKWVVADSIAHDGQIIIDECHHLPAFSFEQVVKQAKGGRTFLGQLPPLFAKTDDHPIIMMQCGPVVLKPTEKCRAKKPLLENMWFLFAKQILRRRPCQMA